MASIDLSSIINVIVQLLPLIVIFSLLPMFFKMFGSS